MNRRYSTEDFARLVNTIKSTVADCSVGIDILAGFPGETEKYFQETLSLLAKLDISYLHAFPYSLREGTKAAQFGNQVASAIKADRVRQLLALSRRKQQAFNHTQAGKVRSVVVEGRRDAEGRLKGVTDNYIDVRFNGPNSILRSLVSVRLEETTQNFMLGELVKVDEN
jgi:threonylcarbamoyladenosine tRNA methylthiotransferase MtaB